LENKHLQNIFLLVNYFFLFIYISEWVSVTIICNCNCNYIIMIWNLKWLSTISIVLVALFYIKMDYFIEITTSMTNNLIVYNNNSLKDICDIYIYVPQI